MTPRPMIARRRLVCALVASLPLLAAAQGASFPARTLSLVVPYTAGGASDIGARMITADAGRVLGQPIVVDNVAGAGGALGVQKVVRAPADGHTLLYGSLSEALLVPMVNPNAGYKADALLPVAFAGGSPVVFVTRKDFPASTMDEFIALARKSPGKFSYGSPGIGTFQHIMGETFKGRAGLFMLHIPYRGGAQILTDVIGGQIDIGITTAVNAAGFVSGGRLKVIGVSQATRLAALPEAQAFGESRLLRGLELSTWGMVYAPAGTPEPALQALNAAINTALMTPANVQARARLGAELPATMNLAQARAFVANEQAKYAPIVSTLRFE